MTCKDCIHYKVCNSAFPNSTNKVIGVCRFFEDKAKYIELPCKVGGKGEQMSEVFKGKILQSVYGYDYSSREGKKMTYEDVKRIRDNPKIEDCDNEELSRLIDVAVDKQIEKSGIGGNKFKNLCPRCGRIIYPTMKYCSGCGQKLKWADNPLGK